VAVASAVVDVVLDVPALPDPGGEVRASQVARTPGGAFNVASTASRLGLATVYAGPHGVGPNGDLLRSALRREDISVLGPPSPDEDTGYCLTLVDETGERTFVTVGGADTDLTASHLAAIEWRPLDAAYISGYDLAYDRSGELLADAVTCFPPDVLVVLDPGPLLVEVTLDRWRTVAPRVDVLSWSEREAELLPSLRDLLRDDALVVRRVGPSGAYLEEGNRPSVLVPGRPVRPVDSTGAGDVHVGALVAARHAGAPWLDAVLEANLAAALSTQVRGGAGGPTRQQVLEAKQVS
jgi:sugar/nucleoside kinase (ribokinase family)